ncbi:branched-chain amino acid ABC transporter, permease domain protein, partial [Bordetella pertussis H934]
VGAVYALIGLGLNLTFWTTRVLNFGQGSVLMAGAMLTAVMVGAGVNVFLAVGVSLLVTAFILWIVELVGVRRGDRDHESAARQHRAGLPQRDRGAVPAGGGGMSETGRQVAVRTGAVRRCVSSA